MPAYSVSIFRDSSACSWSSPPVVTIDGNGQMSLSSGHNLDYEHCSRFVAKVSATGDDGARIQCDATIQVQDVNEQPQLTNCGAARKLSEGDPVNSLVTPSLYAEDVDIGQELFFSVTGGSGVDYFRVSSCGGAISIQQAITSSAPKTFTLDIKVQDDHAATESDTCTITITVDNRAPSVQDKTITTTENAAVDDHIGTVVVRATRPTPRVERASYAISCWVLAAGNGS